MRFDEIFTILGDFGTYQRRVYILLCLPAIIIGSFMMNIVIIVETPKHRCKVPGLKNDTYHIFSQYQRVLVDKYIPTSDDNVYDQCHIYSSQYNATYNQHNATKVKCNDWVYDRTTFRSTFTSKLNLVCDHSLFASLAETVFYFGVLVGDFLFGVLADRFGRTTSMYLGILLLISSSFGVCWSPNYVVFCSLQFAIGAACHGVFVVCYVLGMEIVGAPKRNFAAVLVGLSFTTGLIYLSGMAYLFKDWQYLAISLASPCVLFLPYWWIVPESPRWLMSNGNREQAAIILKKMASVNKVKLTDETIDSIQIDQIHQRKGKLWHLFSTKVLSKRTLILFFNWAVVSLVYFGVTMNAGQLSGNYYLNFFLLVVVELPASLIALFLIDRFGRQKTYSLFMLLGGLSCLSTLFTVVYGGKGLQPLTSTLAIIGKLCSAVSFSAIYILSAELYPTIVRNAGMGASSCVARIGSMSAPYVAKTSGLVNNKFGQALPLVIFGGCSLVAALLSFLLPETLHKKLPETMDDAQNFNRKLDIKEDEIEPLINNDTPFS